MRLAKALRALVAILDTPGGHIVVLTALVVVGVALQVRGHESSGKELTSGALGALFAVLRYYKTEAAAGGVKTEDKR